MKRYAAILVEFRAMSSVDEFRKVMRSQFWKRWTNTKFGMNSSFRKGGLLGSSEMPGIVTYCALIELSDCRD